MQIPGKLGYPLLGDHSLSLATDPIKFINKQTSDYGPIFKTRIINKPFVFITSYNGAYEMLNSKADCFSMNYHSYVSGLFESNIAFVNGEHHQRLKSIIEPIFSEEMMALYQSDIKTIISNFFTNLEVSQHIDLYQTLKLLINEISIYLFLGIFKADSLYSTVEQLLHTHWHGLISVPISFTPSVKFGYSKALEAKIQLLDILRQRLSQPNHTRAGILLAIDTSQYESLDETAENLLLFASAVIPKALTSLLSSFCLQISLPGFEEVKNRCLDTVYFDAAMLEIQRLQPPFLGGYRVADCDVVIDGFLIPKGYNVVYMAYHVHRDTNIFHSPLEFLPERWLGTVGSNSNATQQPRLFTFGSGYRTCIGKALANMILKECCSVILTYDWDLCEGQDFTYKYLPVARSVKGIFINLKRQT